MSASDLPAAEGPPDKAPPDLRLVASREHALLSLVELSRRLWRSDDLYATAEALLLNLMGQVGTARAALWIKSDGGLGLPVLIRSHGFQPSDATALATSCWTPLARHFEEDPRPVLAAQLPHTLEHAAQALTRRSRAALFAPVRAENETLGLVALGARAGGRRYDALDLEVLEASLAIAGAAMRNTQLKGGVLESNRRLRIANDSLRDLDRLKSQFIDNVNHELRTPLTIVIGCLSCLADANIPVEARRQLVENASRSSDKLLRLIESLLTFSSAARGGLVLEMIEADLAAFLALYHEERRPGVAAGLRELNLVREAAEGRARFDPNRLRALLDELVDNALRFTPQGSSIWIELRDHVEEGRSWLRVDVRDNGYGVPADQLPALFQTFRQADGSATREVGGMGMGLPLALKLAEAMGGRLTATSEPGRGSIFSLRLPAA